MQLSSKIAFSFILIVVLTTAIMLSIFVVERQGLKSALSEELDKQIRLRTTEVLQPIYKLCQVTESQTIPLLQKDLNNASYLLSRTGGVTLGRDKVPWRIVDSENEKVIELPMMLTGGVWLGQVLSKDTPSPIVDDIHDLGGAHCTILQRINLSGDMLAISTSKMLNPTQRAIGTYLRHQMPDGSINQMIHNIMGGITYIERASHKNNWISSIYKPIHENSTKSVIGAICVSISQIDTVQAVRKIMLDMGISDSGYFWVLGSKEDRKGVYIISKDGIRDGESLWDYQDENGIYFVRNIVQMATEGQEGETHYYDYLWKNPGDKHPRMKTSAFTYFEPWEWIIGSSAYKDDFQAPQIRVDATLGNMLYLTIGVGIALILCSVFAGYIVKKVLADFNHEREQQNWLKTNLHELNDKIRGEQEVYPLAENILIHLAKSLGVHFGVLYYKEEVNLYTPISTYGLIDPVNTHPPLRIGEGLVGQAIADRVTVFLEELPETAVNISTGFGYVLPRNIIIKPLIYEDEIIGAIQLGSLKPFDEVKCSFIEQAGETIAIALFTARSRARVDSLLAQTQEQAKDLERASTYKSDFLARMSHEIRTPINAVKGLTGIVLKTKLAEQQRDYLNKVQIASSNLLNIVNDILDFSKVEAGKLEIEKIPFLLDDVIDNLTDVFSDKLKEKDLELVFFIEPSVPRQLKGDPGRLTQILTNLISNSLKFTDKGEITVRTTPVSGFGSLPGKTVLQFQVQDTGTGIGADTIPTLFEPFTQEDSGSTRSKEGTGLGLAICQSLVENMGGSIWVESTLGIGSSFYFTIVLESYELKGRELVLPADLQGLKILIVDHNQWSRRMLLDILDSFGFDAGSAIDCKTALEILESAANSKKPFHLVLLDWNLPDLDSLDFAESLFRHPAISTSSLQIVLMTTSYGLGVIGSKLESSNIHHYLLKPIKSSQLYNCVLSALGRPEPTPTTEDFSESLEAFKALRGRRVLLVEDNSFNRDVAIALLHNVGIDVEIAGNGLEAVSIFHQSEIPFDTILMDIQMPVMDGFAATREIRQLEHDLDRSRKQNNIPISQIPIIAVTAHALKGQKEECIAKGMNDYISKPFEESQLYTVLLKWVDGTREDSIKPTPQTIPVEQENIKDVEFPSVLCTEEALQRIGGRKELYTKMITSFITEAKTFESTIATALENEDLKIAEREVHTIKGIASSIGADELANAAAVLEEGLANNDPAIDTLHDDFRDLLQLVLENIESHYS